MLCKVWCCKSLQNSAECHISTVCPVTRPRTAWLGSRCCTDWQWFNVRKCNIAVILTCLMSCQRLNSQTAWAYIKSLPSDRIGYTNAQTKAWGKKRKLWLQSYFTPHWMWMQKQFDNTIYQIPNVYENLSQDCYRSVMDAHDRRMRMEFYGMDISLMYLKTAWDMPVENKLNVFCISHPFMSHFDAWNVVHLPTR